MRNRLKLRTRKQWIIFALGVVAALLTVALIMLIPSKQPVSEPAAEPIGYNEHMQTIEEMGKPRRERPVIAIIALNEATEVTDLIIPYSVLKRADVADVMVVAEQATPVPLYPFSKLGQGSGLMKIEPHASIQAFDKQYPDGADYVIIPAIQPHDNKVVVDWINAQHKKGANILSVCAGSLTLAATGLLDNRRATTHWAYIDELYKTHPTIQRAEDRRYVPDKGITTTTGITASIPTTVALVEAIAGRPKAEQVARDLGITHWDARHRSSAFKLTREHKKTYMRNWLSLWRHETLGVPVNEGVDEIALALTADAYSRTALSKVLTVGSGDEAIRGKYGLMIHPNTTQATAVKQMLPAPSPHEPAQAIDKALEQITARYGRPTAEIVALTVEYPWNTESTATP